MFHLQRLAVVAATATALALPTSTQAHDFVGGTVHAVLDANLINTDITWRIDGSNDEFPILWLRGHERLFTVARQDPTPIRNTTTQATIWIDDSFELPSKAGHAIKLADRFGVDFEIWRESNDKQWEIKESAYSIYRNWDTSEAETKGSSVPIGRRVSIVIRQPSRGLGFLEIVGNAAIALIVLISIGLTAGMLAVCLNDPRR